MVTYSSMKFSTNQGITLSVTFPAGNLHQSGHHIDGDIIPAGNLYQSGQVTGDIVRYLDQSEGQGTDCPPSGGCSGCHYINDLAHNVLQTESNSPMLERDHQYLNYIDRQLANSWQDDTTMWNNFGADSALGSRTDTGLSFTLSHPR